MQAFLPADILLPQVKSMEQWAVIACDQFSSQPAYWDRVRENAAGAPSTINLILPEAELGTPQEAAHTALINETMAQYLADGIFRTYPRSFVYVERTLESGAVRKGLVGMVDLDAYDYSVGSTSAIRATEKTVVERIPPRMRVRKDAPIELPHILMLCDDHDKVLIEPVAAQKDSLPQLYDFDLMEDGGHITGWLVQGEAVDGFEARLADYTAHVGEKYAGLPGVPMVFAVGDGNHSLATAKAIWQKRGQDVPADHPARYAMCELTNLFDPALVFDLHVTLRHDAARGMYPGRYPQTLVAGGHFGKADAHPVEHPGLSGGEHVVKPSAGHQAVIVGTHIQSQDGVVLPQLEAAGPVPGQVLRRLRSVGVHCHHRQDAAGHLVPVGVVEAHSLLRLVREDIRLVHHVLPERGGAQGRIQLGAALRRRHVRPLVQPIGGGEDDGQYHNGNGHAFFLEKFHRRISPAAPSASA